jgi:hypothetical protein
VYITEPGIFEFQVVYQILLALLHRGMMLLTMP